MRRQRADKGTALVLLGWTILLAAALARDDLAPSWVWLLSSVTLGVFVVAVTAYRPLWRTTLVACGGATLALYTIWSYVFAR